MNDINTIKQEQIRIGQHIEEARKRLEGKKESFSELLLSLIEKSQMKESEVYRKACIDRRHFYKIKKNADYSPNKKTVVAFALALELSLVETSQLLNSAGYALSESLIFDIIIAYFIENEMYDIYEINQTLYHYKLPVFQ